MNQADNYGSTPLYIASQQGHLEVVEALIMLIISEDGSIDQAKNNGVTPLFVASQNGHLGVVKTLVESHANIHLNVDGQTALSLAKKLGYIDIVKYLQQEIGIVK